MCPVLPFGGLELHAYALFPWTGVPAACLLALPARMRTGMSAFQSLTIAVDNENGLTGTVALQAIR